MKTMNAAILMAIALVAGGCAGRGVANKPYDGPRWGVTYKGIKIDYASAGDAAGRNAAIDALQELVEKSPDKPAADLVRQTLCPWALSEGRVDVLDSECRNSEMTLSLLRR